MIYCKCVLTKYKYNSSSVSLSSRWFKCRSDIFISCSVHVTYWVCCFADPEWASYTLGVFVCHGCSGHHRTIAQISKVKNIVLDPWRAAEIQVRYIRTIQQWWDQSSDSVYWGVMHEPAANWCKSHLCVCALFSCDLIGRGVIILLRTVVCLVWKCASQRFAACSPFRGWPLLFCISYGQMCVKACELKSSMCCWAVSSLLDAEEPREATNAAAALCPSARGVSHTSASLHCLQPSSINQHIWAFYSH